MEKKWQELKSFTGPWMLTVTTKTTEIESIKSKRAEENRLKRKVQKQKWNKIKWQKYNGKNKSKYIHNHNKYNYSEFFN